MTDPAPPSPPRPDDGGAGDGGVGDAAHVGADAAPRRLRPVRAGIVGLWDYTVAEFAFADGRLVLRGANGSGKTKALEVLFPFVLDGRLDPRRLDPFSGENRTMKENLLWGGRETGHGYAWLEFGDSQRWVTVGVGLRAQKHRQSPDSWFFVTDRRVGHDLYLVDDEGRPRTKRDLAAELGEVVVERASEHRRRVDDALFGLGPERYEAMLDLVLTLRRPMLAKDLDPRLLSETLSRGLRPLDDELIEQVARSFDDLEAVQRELDRIIAADEAASAFVTEYRGYLRTQARHRADQAIEADAAVRDARAALDDAERRIDEARATETMTEAELEAASARLEQDRARRDALRASDAFRSAEQLEHLATAVRDLAAERDRAAHRSEEAAQAADAEVAASEAAQRAAEEAGRELEHQRGRIVDSSDAAGIDWDPADGHGPSEEIRQRTAGRAAARRADLEVVDAAVAEVARATERVGVADAAVDRAQEAEAAAASALHEAAQAAETARDDLLAAIDGWASTHPDVVEDEDREAVRGAVLASGAATVAEMSGASPDSPDDEAGDGGEATSSASQQPGAAEVRPTDVWRDRLQPRLDAIRERRTRHQGHLEDLRARGDELEEHRQAILDERDDAPTALPWHGDDRDAREGAPLWAAVRFADDVTDGTAAGVEAALEAAGLLDAWIRPDGTVSDDADAFLVVDGEVTDGPTLADVLVPEEEGRVPAETVARLLRSVPLGELERAGVGSVIGGDGRYRIGPLAGRHQVSAARYIGATARAAHRARRVERIDEQLAELDRRIAEVETDIAQEERNLDAAGAATAALPSDEVLRARARERDLAAGRLQQARTASAAAEDAASEARRLRNERHHALQREARARGLPAEPDGLAEVAAALERFSEDGHALVTASERQATREATAAEAARRAALATQAADAAGADAGARHRHHDTRAAELETLRDQLGDEAREVVEQLEQVEAAIDAGTSEEQRLSRAAREAAAVRGEAEGKLDGTKEALRVAQETAATAREHLRRLARADVAGPLDLEPPEDDDALLTAIDELVTGVSGAEERRKAAQTRVIRALEELDRALGSDHRPNWTVDDDVIVVTISDDGRERSIAAFASRLAAQRAEQEALLTERERTLFEDALLSSVCGQIHTRTQATRELVATMDVQMRARRLSSGHTVGVAWRPDDVVGPEWKRVHRLLDQDPAHFGPEQLESLRRHFAAEIAAARAADPHAPYRELLATVLDYRRWRRFELSLIEADGSSAPLTRARHARLSGGEKAASLHLPLFAAAHGAFAGGRPDSPRLLGLDEAFAGIDDTGRSELLSLTVAFDLDLFMTGYDLWAVDASVPGVAHYDLLHLPDAHTVSTLLVLWNGRELLEGPDATMALSGAASPSDRPDEADVWDGGA